MLPNGALGTGFSSYLRARDLSDYGAELDECEALGVEAIELPTYDLDLVIGGRIRRPQLEALKRATSGRNVVYSAHGPLSINFMDEPWRLPRHFEVLKPSLEVAAELGAHHYVLHTGRIPQQLGEGVEAAYARQREYLAKAGDLAADLGLIICVETLFAGYHGNFLTATPKRLAAELAAVNHKAVAATLDFSHSYIKLSYDGRRDAFLEEVAALAPHARHLHIHDSFGRQDDIWMYSDGERTAYGHGDLHLPVGWGDIPFDRIIETCVFPRGVIFNIELEERYKYAAAECVAATKALAERARTQG